jgi:sulfide dehydrogenase cytochrome subunit
LEDEKVNTIRISSQAIAISALLLLSGPTVAGMALCTGCHGEDGRGGDSQTPIIAGLPDILQEDALFAYIDGSRKCESKPMKCMMVANLAEDQVMDAAAHFGAMPYVSAGEDFDAALVDAGKAIHDKDCAMCHGADGPDASAAAILHGQRKDYLRYSLELYATGGREQSAAKEKKISPLTSEDIEALLNYYASYRN